MVLSLILGTALGLVLISAPSVAGDTAITDPVVLGAIWFVRPQSMLVLVPPLLHIGVGVSVGVLGQLFPAVKTTVVVLVAVAINAAATLVENGMGAGVMGVGWWLIGSLISAVLMLLGATVVRRITRRLKANCSGPATN